MVSDDKNESTGWAYQYNYNNISRTGSLTKKGNTKFFIDETDQFATDAM